MSRAETASSILSLTATEMARRIGTGELTSIELVETHIERIESINSSLNAMVVPLFDEARAAASAADQMVLDGKGVGPLHGVPISIKEFFDVRGTLTTAGIASADNSSASEDAPLVARLRTAGAIVLGKTNVSQMGIAIESENPVYGRTSNPWDLERSPGGSSGGESALIAAGGSPLGLGSDGGGSIRIPAHFCGICGLKPTTNRLTMRGHWQFPAFPPGWSQPGPLARSVSDLELAMRCLIAKDGEPLDPSVAPGTLRPSNETDISELTIGYYVDDNLFTPSPAIRRACESSVEALGKAGVNVVEFIPPNALDAWNVNLGLFYADGGKWMTKHLGKSPLDPRIKKTLIHAKLPTAVRRALPRILESMGQNTLAEIMRRSRHHHLSAFGYQSMLVEQQAFRATFLDRLDEQNIDVLVCPPFASVAMKHLSTDIVLALAYTFLFNLLGMPAGVVPISVVQAGEESDRKNVKDDVVTELRRAEEGSHGMPVGVQVVARHWREDMALAVMRYLEEAFRKTDEFPQTPLLTQ